MMHPDISLVLIFDGARRPVSPCVWGQATDAEAASSCFFGRDIEPLMPILDW